MECLTFLQYVCQLTQTDVIIKASIGGQMSKFLQQWLMVLETPTHPNLMKVLGVCADFEAVVTEQDKGTPIKLPLGFVLPYMPSKVECKGNLPQWLECTLGLARALDALHQGKLVHGQVAAHNLFLNDQKQIVLGGFEHLAIVGDCKAGRRQLCRDVDTKRVVEHMPPEVTSTLPLLDVVVVCAGVWQTRRDLFDRQRHL